MKDFYYDLLDKFINRTNIELIQIGSNILYIVLSVLLKNVYENFSKILFLPMT